MGLSKITEKDTEWKKWRRDKDSSRKGLGNKKNNDAVEHVSPDRLEIYFTDSAHSAIVLSKERIGRNVRLVEW